MVFWLMKAQSCSRFPIPRNSEAAQLLQAEDSVQGSGVFQSVAMWSAVGRSACSDRIRTKPNAKPQCPLIGRVLRLHSATSPMLPAFEPVVNP